MLSRDMLIVVEDPGFPGHIQAPITYRKCSVAYPENAYEALIRLDQEGFDGVLLE